MALCRCSKLYQATKRSTHAHAASREANGLRGYDGTYFNVRKSASENALSSLTLGLLNDATTPRSRSVASIVAPFIAPPLSECRVSESGVTSCSPHALANAVAASSAHSVSCTAARMMRRLHTSTNRYR